MRTALQVDAARASQEAAEAEASELQAQLDLQAVLNGQLVGQLQDSTAELAQARPCQDLPVVRVQAQGSSGVSRCSLHFACACARRAACEAAGVHRRGGIGCPPKRRSLSVPVQQLTKAHWHAARGCRQTEHRACAPESKLVHATLIACTAQASLETRRSSDTGTCRSKSMLLSA